MSNQCFACGRRLTSRYRWARVHGETTIVQVGSDCYDHIARAGSDGWQPPSGGPRLHQLTTEECDALTASAEGAP